MTEAFLLLRLCCTSEIIYNEYTSVEVFKAFLIILIDNIPFQHPCIVPHFIFQHGWAEIRSENMTYSVDELIYHLKNKIRDKTQQNFFLISNTTGDT